MNGGEKLDQQMRIEKPQPSSYYRLPWHSHHKNGVSF